MAIILSTFDSKNQMEKNLLNWFLEKKIVIGASIRCMTLNRQGLICTILSFANPVQVFTVRKQPATFFEDELLASHCSSNWSSEQFELIWRPIFRSFQHSVTKHDFG